MQAIYLPEDYIPSLLESYPDELIQAYLHGQFVNLKSGTVYRAYNRVTHNSKETINPSGDILFVGMDFNINHMAARILVKRSNGFHCVAELKDVLDTPEIIKIIQDRWPRNKNYRVIIYPDASGANGSSRSASVSDIGLLIGAGFEVRARPSNPPVKDRVNAVNIAFSKGKLWVNAKLCPTTASDLESRRMTLTENQTKKPDLITGMMHWDISFITKCLFFIQLPQPELTGPKTMSVKNTHPDYDNALPDIQIVRDFYKGERHVKGKTITYLSPTVAQTLDGLNPGEPGAVAYKKYIEGARVPDYVKQKVENAIGILHKEDADVS